jgi:ribonucleoside-diphosphate reductase alpha chain
VVKNRKALYMVKKLFAFSLSSNTHCHPGYAGGHLNPHTKDIHMTAAKNVPAPTMPPISDQIWGMKYQFKKADGTPIDKDVTDTWSRIAKDLSLVEKNPKKWEKIFFEALSDFKYLPAGRITAGAGTARKVTLFNCFVMGTVPDSMGGIFDMLKEAALTMQQGGGIGYDFSTIRPSGADVLGVSADASGPLSFMDVWDAMCRTIMSAGSRRGAMMATMRCDHPDVEAFIAAKQDPVRLRMFNMSVLITDPFMEAVKANADWDLHFEGKVYKTVNALDLWNTIMHATYDFAEPGVIFIDRINNANNLNYCETIAATNPCGEQPLPPYGACLLGSINMARLIPNPFHLEAELDLDMLNKLVETAVRMMDNVVDTSNFPLPEQEKEAKDKRRIGLGVTGLADALLMVGLRYGSDEAAAQTEVWMKAIARAAYLASIKLAKEKGAFPLFDAEKYLASGNMMQMDDDIREAIRTYGIRNALLTSIAPTGTISLYAGNVSSGIEPVFAYSYTRKVLQKDGSRTEEEVIDYAVQMWRDLKGDEPLPDYFVNAQTLPPMEHVKMQAAAQKWVDSSISKTINCPEDINFDDFKEVYMGAWDQGCKGCTTYRPNDVTGSVLSVTPEKGADNAKNETEEVFERNDTPADRDQVLIGGTYKLKWPDLEHAFYITINDRVLENGNKCPHEIFINTKNVESKMWIDTVTLLLTAVFRRTEDASFIVEELEGVFDPRGGSFMPGQGFVPSLASAIGGILRQHVSGLGLMAAKLPKGVKAEAVVDGEVQATDDVPDLGPKNIQREGCKDYGNCNIVFESGCKICKTCSWSACA